MPGPNELGEFLRARRGRLRPDDVGLPPGAGARRTPGLRREEIAALAGLSIDYYIRLEQGKESNPSGPILDGLARALRLSQEEHAHLYALANHATGRAARPLARASRVVRPGILRLLETVRPCPAHVLTRTSDLLAANAESLTLLTGLTEWPPERRNTIRYLFLHPAGRELFADWDHDAETSTAHLRSLAASTPDDPDLSALVTELTEGSAEFARLWHRHNVRQRRGQAKRFRHPQVGELTLTNEPLYLADGQRISIYQAEPGSRDHDALTLALIFVATGRHCLPGSACCRVAPRSLLVMKDPKPVTQVSRPEHLPVHVRQRVRRDCLTSALVRTQLRPLAKYKTQGRFWDSWRECPQDRLIVCWPS